MGKKARYIDFFKLVGKSKRLTRSGWIREKIRDPESVAEHSFRVGFMAMVLSDGLGYNLDKNKLIKMALLHDIAEVVTGDLVIERGEVIDLKKRDEKEKLEEEGIRKIFDTIGKGDEYAAIFHEMIQRDTAEAEMFWQLDKLEMAIQALEYEEEQRKNLEEFFVTAELHIKDSLLKELLAQIKKQRKKKKQ